MRRTSRPQTAAWAVKGVGYGVRPGHATAALPQVFRPPSLRGSAPCREWGSAYPSLHVVVGLPWGWGTAGSALSVVRSPCRSRGH
ncbi:hypothetical protein NDU88_001013 [Pleurodeles waltl]|uniref:Uncharacterized protein n=1 Tax=Pleurodeles waltl TaxID=8319 RepID=A0AAV7N9L0_PLEWA|nr:hypothetical protein NDU88_001013 [Pleurodeles waltl]